jgi:protein-S-isoprenylcysteine O-methyltransferase Ste14
VKGAGPTAPPRHDLDVIPTRGQRLRYLAFGRVVPGSIYAIYVYILLNELRQELDAAGGRFTFDVTVSIVTRLFYVAFCVIPIAIYLTRPMPRARDGTIPARAAAFVGTTVLLAEGSVGVGPGPAYTLSGLRAFFAVSLMVATALEVIILLRLRSSFSIMPEARSLVTTGPYAVVRHPLYFAEILGALSGVLANGLFLVPALFLIPFVAIQYLRTRFEERVLTHAFPEYTEYARRTSRLIPWIW